MDNIRDPDKKPKPGRPKNEEEVPFEQMTEAAQILYLYADGKSDAGVCSEIQLTKEEFQARIDDDPAFKRLVSFGRTVCQAVWEEAYNTARKGGKMPAATMVNFAMKNLFGWAEKSETTTNDLALIAGMTRDEAMEQIRQHLPGIVDIAEARDKKKAS